MTAANPEVRSVSAFFPCYNDALTIGLLVHDVRNALAPLVDDLEIIVVNDGSADDSAQVLERLATEVPELRVVTHDRNRGYGAALRSGFDAATKEWVFYTDGDGQYDPTEASQLVAAVRPDVDIVQGWKLARGDNVSRRFLGRAYHHGVRVLFGLHVRDTDCDFRLFRRSLLERTRLRSTSGVICVEMMRSFQDLGARFAEVPVHHYARPHGRSQFFRLPHLARTGIQLADLWIRLVVLRAR